MRNVLALALMFLSTAHPASAKGEEILFGPVPSWVKVAEPLPVPAEAKGAIFVRYQNVEAHVDKTGQYNFISQRVRLLDPSALKMGNLSLSWNPAAGSPVVHAVKVHRGNSVRDVLAATKFEVLRRENQLEMSVLDGTLTAVLSVPDLRVDDELEVAFTLPSHDPTLGPDSFGLLFIGTAPPPGRIAMRLSWDKGLEPFTKIDPEFTPILKRDADSVGFSVDNPSFLNLPKSAPPRFGWRRTFEFSDFSSWQAVSSRLAPIYDKAASLQATSQVKQEAALIAKTYSDPKDRAAAALELVQKQVRYIYIGLGGGNLSPATAEETWQRRYGDCKGKTVLLLALLKELGIPAEAVLVNNSGTDDGLDQRLPSVSGFDHVLVRAQIGTTSYWLDGTLPHVFGMTAEPILPYRWALPLSAGGRSLEPLAWKPKTTPGQITLLEIDARAGFAETASQRLTIIIRGPGAIGAYLGFGGLSEGEIENTVRQQQEGSEEWTRIDKVSWRFDKKGQASIFEITGEAPVEWESIGNGSKQLILASGGFSPPYKRQRSSDQDATAPFAIDDEFECTVTTLRLPKTTAERDWSFNESYNRVMFGQSLRRSIDKRDGAIRIIRTNRTLQNEIDAPSATKDNALIAKFDNSKALVFYDPNSADMKKPAETVPATYEINWTENFSACLEPPRKK